MVIALVVTGIVLFFGISIAGGAGANFVNILKKYKNKTSSLNTTASIFTKAILAQKGIPVTVARFEGRSSDYYDYQNKIIGLNESNYNSSATTAIATAAHEIGHALTHHEKSSTAMLQKNLNTFCRYITPLFWACLALAAIFFIGEGIESQAGLYLLIGAGGIFAINLLFKLITLQNEALASRIALKLLHEHEASNEDIQIAKKLYGSAFISYIGDIFTPFVKLLNFLSWLFYNTLGRFFR